MQCWALILLLGVYALHPKLISVNQRHSLKSLYTKIDPNSCNAVQIPELLFFVVDDKSFGPEVNLLLR